MPKKKKNETQEQQSAWFIEDAKKLDCNESQEGFERVFDKIVSKKPKDEKPANK